MKAKKVLLIGFGVGAICGGALLPLAASRSVPGGPPSDLFGVGGMLLSFSSMGALVTAYRQADELNRNPGAWGLASFLFPWAVPFALVFQKEGIYDPGWTARRKIRVADGQLTVRTGLLSSVRLRLDGLRLLSLTAPGGKTQWRWKPAQGPLTFESRSQVEFHPLDLMTDEDQRTLLSHYLKLFREGLTDKKGKLLPERKRLEVMTLFHLHLKGYDEREVTVTLKDVLAAGDDVLFALQDARVRRIQQLQEWLATNPEVAVGNAFPKSQRPVLSEKGIRLGKEFLPWEGIKALRVVEKSGVEVELRDPPSRWTRTRTLTAKQELVLAAAADVSFWADLHRFGNAAVVAGIEHDELAGLLDGMAVCTVCNTIRDAVPGQESECCHRLQVRFRRAEKGQACSHCGVGLSDEAVGVNTRIGEVFSRKGFVCSDCNRVSCLACAPKEDSGGPSLACLCGQPLAIRV
jgi:hypothetical protein